VRRPCGQVEAIEQALNPNKDCAEIMQLVVSVLGAANSLMAEQLEVISACTCVMRGVIATGHACRRT
jgi:DNA-binding FrmR family transcriptional regulator